MALGYLRVVSGSRPRRACLLKCRPGCNGTDGGSRTIRTRSRVRASSALRAKTGGTTILTPRIICSSAMRGGTRCSSSIPSAWACLRWRTRISFSRSGGSSRATRRWLRKVPEGLWVMTPVNLPLYGSRVGRWLNRILLVVQLRWPCCCSRISRPILWVAIPTAAEMAGRLGEKLLLYQVSDKYDANEDSALSAQIIRRYDRQLKDAADVVLYSGRKLFQRSDGAKSIFSGAGCGFRTFFQPEGQSLLRSLTASHIRSWATSARWIM